MKIQPTTIKNYTNNYSGICATKQNKNSSFKATLNVDKEVYSIGQSFIFKEAIKTFKNMLSEEPTFKSDVVKLFKCPFYLSDRTGKIKVTPREHMAVHTSSDESYCPSRTHPIEPRKYKYYTSEEWANLGMSLNDKAEIGFYYDERRTLYDLANDLFNTYKHLRYQSHYTGRNEMIYEKRKSAPQGYKVTWYNRFDQPVKETYSFSVDSLIKHRTTMYKYADDGSIVDIQYSSEYQNGV